MGIGPASQAPSIMTRLPEATLQDVLGIQFRDASLLRLALTHRSYLHERPDEAAESNERLEYLGDALLGLAIAEELYRRFPDSPEGRLTELRSRLVRAETLADLGHELKLGDYLYLGRGEEQSGGRSRGRTLARALEAVIGAVLIDQGHEAAKRWTLTLFQDRLMRLPDQEVRDYKSLLQEVVQAEGKGPPVYRTINAEGPDHDRDFTVEVLVGDGVLGRGRGRSKRIAQTEAARIALARLTGG
ncbi:MAG: ribonuclease III [Chloroflexi bacterium]|nr:ribonuclease III [Chloroflexota bacterium]